AAGSPVLHSGSAALHAPLLLGAGLTLLALHRVEDLVGLPLVEAGLGWRGLGFLRTASAASPTTAAGRWRRRTEPLGKLQVPLGPIRRRRQKERLPEPVRGLRQELFLPRRVVAGGQEIDQAQVVERTITQRRIERSRRLLQRASRHLEAPSLECGRAGIVEGRVPRGAARGIVEELRCRLARPALGGREGNGRGEAGRGGNEVHCLRALRGPLG